ncbi:MAG: tetratricopeptide repeat protein [Anaerolineales bacterium]|nr:tetratricopeptide repeat protein [Anaerolineales bacterium]
MIKEGEPSTARLELRLLGRPQVHLDGAAVTDFRTAKVEALLYYLAVTGRPHGRESLVTLLWGDMPEAAAKRNLTQVLSLLRKQFGLFLEITPQQIGLKPEPPYWVDVQLFQQALETIDPTQEPERLRRVVELYQGDFLQGFYVKEALDFEEWVLTQRERLRELMIQALDSLVSHYLGQADYPTGLDSAARLLALEPWRETAHRQMMLLLARSGRREAALAQYETCRRILAEELGVEPMAETTALYQRLKAAVAALPHNLPPPTTFVGRERELSHLQSRLSQPDCRLLTLVGPGGIGKTRLAIEAARRCLEPTFGPDEVSFADGVYFVNLAPVSAGETTGGLPEARQATNPILVAIAAAVGFSFQGAADLKTQVFDHLRRKEMLLVLDNFEHLVEEAGLLVELLNAVPGIRLLVTSRERLNLREEWVWEVGGLDYPRRGTVLRQAQDEREPGSQADSQISIADLQTYEAIVLFCLQAQRIRGDFSLSENEAPYVLRLCQLVEGAPLALELATSWLRVLSCAEVVARVERSLDFLSSSLRNVPERHRSVRAVFEQSWQMLSEPEQAVFRRLSLFKGGFQREAAQTVAGARLPILTRLVGKSLLRLTPSGRYQLHEVLRQFAAEKLLVEADPLETHQPQPESALAVWQRYSTYYLRWVNQREANLRGSTPQLALSELWTDVDNICQAWHWAVVAAQIDEIEAALGGFARFYDLTSLFEEGAAVFGQAANDLHEYGGTSDEGSKQALQKTVVKLWVEQARLLNRRGLSEQALQVIPRAAELAHQIQDTALEALAYHQWGETLFILGQPALSQARLEKALGLARAAEMGAIEAEALRHLGLARNDLGDAAGALKFYQESLARSRHLKDLRGEGLALNNLAYLQRRWGQWAEAETHFEQALHIFQEIDYRWGQDTVLYNLGNLRCDLGRYSQAQALCQQSRQICAEIKDYWGECHVLNSLGNILREQGDFSTAHSYYQQALQLWRTIGVRFYEGVTLAELALLGHLTGHNEAASDYSQQAEQIGQEIGSPEIRASALTHLGHAQVALNFLPEAAKSYRQALLLRQEMGQPHFAREILAGLCRVALAQGHLEQAQAFVTELLPQLEIKYLYGTREPFRVYLTCYLVLQAGHDARAGDVLAAAYRLLQERSAEIVDERLRRFYLENIPAHQEIVRAFSHQATDRFDKALSAGHS